MSSKSIADVNNQISAVFLSEANFKSNLENIEQFYSDHVHKYSFVSKDGYKLTAVGIKFKDSPFKYPLVIIPGRGEIAHKYAEFLYSMSNLRLNTYILFARGQGESQRLLADPQRCHLDEFNILRTDLQQMLEELRIEKYLLMGFSLGGLMSLDLIVNGNGKPLKCCLIAPFLWPYFRAPVSMLYAFVNLLGSLPFFKYAYTPHGGAYKKVLFEENYHSHSKVRYEAYHNYYAQNPQLTIGGPTYSFVKQCVNKQRELFEADFKFRLPLRVYICGNDKVVSSEQAERFFLKHETDGSPLEIKRVDKVFHDVLNETDFYRTPILAGALSFLYGE